MLWRRWRRDQLHAQLWPDDDELVVYSIEEYDRLKAKIAEVSKRLNRSES